MVWQISKGMVLRRDGMRVEDLGFEPDGRIARSGSGANVCQVLDADGLLVLPGVVDVHGDGFERQIMPRPGVRFDLGMALRDTDRQLVANGITTAFHGVTVSWEPGLRSREAAARFVATFQHLRPVLACDTRLHLRWETFALEALEDVIGWLTLQPHPMVALNDHTTGSVLKGTIARKIGQMAERAGLTRDAYMELLDDVWAHRDEVPAAIDRLARAVADQGCVLLAHDEASPQDREQFRRLGAHASEFPLTLETAQAARVAGEHVILGAPNVVRGGSHNGALDAGEAVRAGLCTVLASDYYYPALMHAAFCLAAPEEPGFGAAWDLVSANAAQVAGLSDRGRLEPGLRGDVIVVDATDRSHPEVVATFVAGELVYGGKGMRSRPGQASTAPVPALAQAEA